MIVSSLRCAAHCCSRPASPSPQVFLVVTGLLNACWWPAYIFLLVPEYLLRFIAFMA